ncbi:hypothetical protein DSUL_20348 [Desulfovibrionales bacterium]
MVCAMILIFNYIQNHNLAADTSNAAYARRKRSLTPILVPGPMPLIRPGLYTNSHN